MVPASIENNLAGLRRRERVLTLVWGAACWASISLVLLMMCGLVDWLIDRQRETPLGARLGMFLVQGFVAGLAALLFVLLPQIRRLPDTLLALWVEEKMPQFEHRLISAVQLNQPDAQLDGMSQELVAVVTREAEKLTKRVGGFTQVADHGRLKWAIGVLAPIVLVFAIPFAIWPGVCFALLARQALFPIDVPHSVELESASPKVWPIGEQIPLQFRVRGVYDKDMVGTVFVTREGEWVAEKYPLLYRGPAADGDGAMFGTYIPASSVNIKYSARLNDGRTKYPSPMKLAPRPVASADAAWVRLPKHCGLRPAKAGRSEDERRYEEEQEAGKVVGIPGSAVRVQFEVDSLDHKGYLVLLAPDTLDPARSDDENRLLEKDRTSIPMHVKAITKTLRGADGKKFTVDAIVAETTFDLTDRHTGFHLIIKDENGFENLNPPRWSLKQIPEPAPYVALLRDSFGVAGASFDLEGLPVPIGGHIRIPYECSGRYGLGRAQVLYRLVKKQESGEKQAEEDDWIASPLFEEIASAKTGPFDPKTGVFLFTRNNQSVDFHAVPSRDDDRLLGRTLGGGRHHLKTSGLLDKKTGKALELKSGDLIEYCIKVYAPLHEPEASTPYAISEPRVTEVMTMKQWNDWLTKVGQEDARIKELAKHQLEVSPGSK